jgi:S-adenosylmethionine:tRNA ribosyltransferase-isomerase
MRVSDFDYELPDELIAQTPLEPRDASLLMVVGRHRGVQGHRHFHDLPTLLRAGDCLVLNDSRVLPARLVGRKNTGGVVELLLLRRYSLLCWEVLARPARRLKMGASVVFGSGELTARVVAEGEDGLRHVEFAWEHGSFEEVLDRLGRVPLPPYIHQELADPERYQTVYSRQLGSAAAPTAGLHFTPELLSQLQEAGVRVVTLTLHVGLGTFRPVQVEDVEAHAMHAEAFSLDPETATAINATHRERGRVIAVGTTSARTLESLAASDVQREDGIIVEAGSGETSIFIYPGYRFQVIDGLLTNFHLPKSTLLMLVAAFAGTETVLAAYREAVSMKYRFFSFGDAMLIV